MRLSELIYKLQQIKDKKGDLCAFVYGDSYSGFTFPMTDVVAFRDLDKEEFGEAARKDVSEDGYYVSL